MDQLDILGGSTAVLDRPPAQAQPEQLAWALGDDRNRGQLAIDPSATRKPPSLPDAVLSLPLASRVRGVERRVRLFQRCKGWRFAFEVLEAEGWRQVQEREPGSSWSAEEAVKRASVYAELVGARLVR